jgi:ubiquinone/menaquinone biosynthesis C-methylase UbiE
MSIRARVVALTYDRQMAKVEDAGLRELRHRVLAGVTGEVLEIGAGTGANLPAYRPGVALTLTEPEAPMMRRLERRARQHPSPVTVLRAPAEDIPYDDGSFDVVVSTLVLCAVTDQRRALREVHRVLRLGGRLVFVEHVRSQEPQLARLQDRMNGLNRFVAGCECNRPTLETIRAAGFDVDHVEHLQARKVPPFVRPFVAGWARAVPGCRYAPQAPTTSQTSV